MRRVPGPRELTAECDGLRFLLDLGDDVQRSIYFECYEPSDVALLTPLIPPGGVCLDAGANVGFYTLHFARRVGPEGRVHAFEPDPRNAARLRANCALNGFGPIVEVREAAISDREGTASLHRSEAAHSGWGSLAPGGGAESVTEVETTTLDAYLARMRLDRVDLLKADVEGSECALLLGARESLRSRRIRRLFIEFNGVRLREQGKGLEDFLRPLEEAGYAPAASHAGLVDRMRSGEIPPHTVWPNLLFEPAGGAGGSDGGLDSTKGSP